MSLSISGRVTRTNNAPKASTKHTSVVPTAAESDPATLEPSESDNSEKEMVSRLVQKMVASNKKRREAYRKELKSGFAKRCEVIEQNISISFDSSASRDLGEKVKRLGVLLKRKKEIEKEIMKRVKMMERAYLDANQELSVTLRGRVDDVNGMGNGDRASERESLWSPKCKSQRNKKVWML